MGDRYAKAGGRGRTRTPAEVLEQQTEDALLDVERLLKGEKWEEADISKLELLKEAAYRGGAREELMLRQYQIRSAAEKLGFKLDKLTYEDLGKAMVQQSAMMAEPSSGTVSVTKYTLSSRL